MQPSFNLTWTDSATGNRVMLENMSSSFLVKQIQVRGLSLIDPEISICPNQEYLGEPKK